jgi:16S rRNA processing protein RimM
LQQWAFERFFIFLSHTMLNLDRAELPLDAIAVGRIIDAWGIKGWIKVAPYSTVPEALFCSKRWFIQPKVGVSTAPSAKARAAAQPAVIYVLPIAQAKEHTGSVVACSNEVPDRTAAERLKGAEIFVSRTSFPTPGKDEYYWVDLLGLDVHNREGEHLGQVSDLLHTGPQTVLVITKMMSVRSTTEPPTSGAECKEKSIETLIPFVAVYIDTVDLPSKRITVDWQLGD